MRLKVKFLVTAAVLSSCFSFSQKQGYVQPLTGSDLSIEMAAIPSGTFSMGSPTSEKGHKSDEGPERQVFIDGFWMSRYEITWQLYDLFLQRSIDHVKNTQKGDEVNIDIDGVSGATVPYVDMTLGMGNDEGLPVGNVTQRSAIQFCKWLSAKTGHFYRLPTEAEWEYAASAGNEAPYFFGNDDALLDEYAWYASNSDDTYHKVGGKKPNPWGLYDIYGNVAEWTLDQYDENAYSDDATFYPTTKEYPVVVRGGSFQDDALKLRTAAREASDPIWKQRDPQFPKSKWWNTDAAFVGFRVVRPFKKPTDKEFKKYWGE